MGHRTKRREHPKAPAGVQSEIERTLQLLRSCIHQKGFTQLQIQDALGWGRTYISQLIRQQKSLRLDQILQVLQVIDIPPVDFFAQLYGVSEPWNAEGGQRGMPVTPTKTVMPTKTVTPTKTTQRAKSEQALEDDVHQLLVLLGALINTLETKGWVSRRELMRALDGPTAFEDPPALARLFAPAQGREVAP